MTRSNLITLLLLFSVIAGACAKKEEEKPAETLVNITVATVTTRDIPLTESAVGAETSVSRAERYDPTQMSARRFYIRLPFPLEIVRRLKIGQKFLI